MRNINHTQLKEVLKISYDSKTPVFIWGTMGIGKSSIVKQVAKQIATDNGDEFKEQETNGEKSFSFIDVRISQLEPSDLRGLPNVDKESHTTKWIPPNWLPKDKDSKGILFFDELNLAPPSIQASAYQLILDRRLGDYTLPENWVIVSAGNTIEDKANVFDLPSPLANRFTHITLSVPDKDTWTAWALQNGIEPSIISFLEFKPSYLFKFDRKNKEKSFPTPRSWEFTSNLLKGREKASNEIKEILISSAVGEGIATEFMAFQRLQSKIDLKNILKNPQSVEQIKEIDLKYSLLSTIVEEYRKDKKQLENILQICNYLNPEFSILLIRFLNTSRGNDFKRDVIKLPTWKELSQKYGKYLLDLKGDN